MEKNEKSRKRCRVAEVKTVGKEVQRGHVSPPMRDDDQDGHYVFALGDNLTSRYKILGKMGEGTFGKVVECWDRQTREYVAIKIVRCKSGEYAMVEIDRLEFIAKNEIGKLHCVQMRNSFDYRNHKCIVFEKLGPSLSDFLKRNNYNAFPVDLVREFARQILESVAYLHDLHLIHTDLKPENILLVSTDYVKLPGCKMISSGVTLFRCLPKSSAIKLIDFGSAVFDCKSHSYIVTTRDYRAPEVILGVGWSYPCDLWSIGCILVELFTGKKLFDTHDNLEHLAMMERMLGSLPDHMVQRATEKKYFKRGLRLNWPAGAASRESIRAVIKLDPLKNLVSQHVDTSSRTNLSDLLQDLLRLDPSERLTAREALDRPFIKNSGH